jgi:hypothetical protein
MRLVKSLIAFCLASTCAVAIPAWAVTVQQTADLSFGQILGGATGTVTIPASTGPRTGSSVILLNGSQFDKGGAAAFKVTNDTASNATYAISLITTPNDVDSASLPLSSFTLSQTSVTLDPDAFAIIYVGATLTVSSSSLSAGSYTSPTLITLQAQ